METELGLAGQIAKRVLNAPLVPLFVVACLVLGSYSLMITPREDRPDIDVPTAVVVIPWPGGGVERVDDQLARRVGGWVRAIPSVTDIRSSSTDHAALLIVEFETGTAETTAYAELDEQLRGHAAAMPVGAGSPHIETFGAERLVMFMATLSSKTHSPRELDQIAGEFSARLASVPGVRTITRYGGEQKAIEILPRLEPMAGYGISLPQMAEVIAAAGMQRPLGHLEQSPVRSVQAGIDSSSTAKLARLPVGKSAAGPVYLEDVADIRDGVVRRNQAVLHGRRGQSALYPAVTLAVTTLAGENVSDVTRRLQEQMAVLRAELLPSDVALTVSYDAGREATKRVFNVLRQLLMGTLIVVGIILVGLGLRAALIIALMMPVSLAVVPFLYYRFDFTLNPVSIAAMILAIGILSDDAVVMLENMYRHFRRAGEKTRELTVKAVNEVGNPTILADLLVVATLLPTAYITGEMGQYVRALPVGASAAVLFSLLVALTITPYFGIRLLRVHSTRHQGPSATKHRQESRENQQQNKMGYDRIYRTIMAPLMHHAVLRWILYICLICLLVSACALVGFRRVQIGLTPLLDRQVFVVHVELPPGASLTETLAATSDVMHQLRKLPDIHSVTLYAGTDAPQIYPASHINIPRETPPHIARIHVEMVPKSERQKRSYEVSRTVAHQLGDWLTPYDATGYIARIPSGPSSHRDITAEIYGQDAAARQAVADRVAVWLRTQPGVVVVEERPDAPLDRLNVWVDPQRAATLGVIPANVTQTLSLTVHGSILTDWAGTISREPVPVVLRLEKTRRDRVEALQEIYVQDRAGHPVPLEYLVTFEYRQGAPVRYRRNLLPITTVFADLDRSVVQPVTIQMAADAEMQADMSDEPLAVRWLAPPEVSSQKAELYWSGEWEMTRDVYRDLGAAGLVVMLLIYLLLAGWFKSYALPLLIMLPIPLIGIGVIPAHWLWGIPIAGTGVLGMITLAGIVARNSILLVDFIKQREGEGMELREAVLQAGVIRTRPILLTAATVMFGSGVLIFEPSLKPLGLTLASGVLFSTLVTLVLIPILYFHVHQHSNAGYIRQLM